MQWKISADNTKLFTVMQVIA